jgi:phospholipase C
VRGFADRFPIPIPDADGVSGKNVWYQTNIDAEAAVDGAAASGAAVKVLAPFHLKTVQSFQYMRVTGTPHAWPDSQYAWGDGRMSEWPRYKQNHSLGYFTQEDLPFQWAMANAFTICDAYHCSFTGNTNPNRVFHWTGGNDPLKRGNGPVLYNQYDNLENDPEGGYSFETYPERLEAAGVSWQIYENMADNFTDNPLAGFRSFRAAYADEPGSLAALKTRGLSTRDLDKLKEDVLNGTLLQVSWIIATAEGSEHPGPSSPAQGADYTAKVLDALTSNPDVWSKTVLIVNFDENDGFFDHVPPPAAPSYEIWDANPEQAVLAGASTVDTLGEYHELPATGVEDAAQLPYHQPYGAGPRVPLYVLSPWSKGGWVDSEVFDHTSVLRFIEARFGVEATNITPWRRAVCGDLTSAFDFADPDNSAFFPDFPATTALADRARSLVDTSTPPSPELPELPSQAAGPRPSRALPYELHVTAKSAAEDQLIQLTFANTGKASAVFHVYDRKHLDRIPRRYTVEPGKQLEGRWDTNKSGGGYDLWVLGPNGFHRHFTGELTALLQDETPDLELKVGYHAAHGGLRVELTNVGSAAASVKISANAYFDPAPLELSVSAQAALSHAWSLDASAHWYDFSVSVDELPGFSRRFAGRVETGRDSWSDPAQGGIALGDQLKIEKPAAD